MTSPLHLLHLEDDLNDAQLVQAMLEADGIECEISRVETRAEFMAGLEAGGVDLVLSDYTLPTFDGMAALEVVHDRWPDLPVILVSGTIGEETAIESMKGGATDYVLKGRLTRLVPAVRRAMKEVETRRARRALEAQLIEAQKMEVIGQLAGGVAHDFANILGVIIGYCDLLTSELGEESPFLKFTEEIRHASQRAVGLTRQLLVFSSHETVQPVVLDLNLVVRDLDKLLRRLIDENIEMNLALGENLGRIKADPGYLGQVLMNLVVNARDAMPIGGRLTIVTSNAEFAHDGVTPGEFVVLAVSDTGAGIPRHLMGRLFEAFFTTKEKGKGTGLGLATCQTIVKQSAGHIAVESEVGVGTTFKIYLPRVDQALPRVAPAPLLSAPRRGAETLLVVEDEPSVRRLACGLLRAQGYDVLSASNGQEALHVAQEHHGEPIRLTVTDVVMPLMGGKVMAEWLQSSYPGMKILFTSGYTEGAITHDGVVDEGVEFLAKPYTPATLARKVRDMLDQ